MAKKQKCLIQQIQQEHYAYAPLFCTSIYPPGSACFTRNLSKIQQHLSRPMKLFPRRTVSLSPRPSFAAAPPHRRVSRIQHEYDRMTTLSALALGLNGGCCFAYSVLFGVMQTKLLEMYGVEARPLRDSSFIAPNFSAPHQILSFVFWGFFACSVVPQRRGRFKS